MNEFQRQTAKMIKELGVEARYKTVGGATVDIAEVKENVHGGGVDYSRFAQCSGCHEAAEWSTWRLNTCDLEPKLQRDASLKTARKWSQDHAETCRAMRID